MPRIATPLSAQGVKAQNEPGRYGDGNGLYLLVRETEKTEKGQAVKVIAKFWLFRYVRDAKMREMGLGPASGRAPVSLADARRKARELLDKIRDGRDPLAEKLMERDQRRVEAAKAMTFKECAAAYIEAHRDGWKNAKHAQQVRNTLATYAEPIIGKLPVQAIDVGLVLKVIQPIWTTKTETADRVRGRIEAVLAWATGLYRQGDNPARWKGNLDSKLSAKGAAAPVEHQPALPYEELPAFMTALRAKDSVSARALEFTILTAVRTAATIGAVLPEIDGKEKLWTVPPLRNKGRKGSPREHRVPLSGRAIEIIEEMKRRGAMSYLFPGGKRGKPLSNAAMSELLKGMRKKDGTPWMDPKLSRPAVVHGFRSTFKDWATERTSFPSEVVEMSLAHAIGDKVEAAYRRGDLLKKRYRFMEEWAKFCAAPPVAGSVTGLRQRSVNSA
jgi:integrase